MNHNNRLSRLLLPTLLLSLLLGACDNRQDEAQAAYAEYQAAMVNGDLRAARQALGALVAADDSNADYWIELGKVSMQLSDFGAAYEAYLRAHELDRANVEVLTMLTQIALRSGNLDVAERQASQLELVAPSNPAVPLTKGYVALRRGDLDEAERQVKLFNEVAPYDSNGKILQARVLMKRDQPDAAIALLQEQIRQQPSDAISLRAIASLFELEERWPEAASALRNYLNWQPTDQQARVRLVSFELRSGQVEAAADATMKGIDKDDVDALLAPWLALGQQGAIADRLHVWAQSANIGRRMAVARFLVSASQGEKVLALVGKEATLPVKPANVVPNALYGAALVQTGRIPEGQARLDQVLEVDQASREALKARAQLRSRLGAHKGALEDAQKLVAIDGDSAAARILLARIHAAAGDQEGAKRTLWQGFHDIAGDRTIYDALRPLVERMEGTEAATRLSEEFFDQRNDQLSRSFG